MSEIISRSPEEILEKCLAQIEAGASLEEVLAQYPQQADSLRSMLLTALELRRAKSPELPQSRLDQLEERIFQRVTATTTTAEPVPTATMVILRPRLFAIAAAAMIVLVAGVVLFTFLNNDNGQNDGGEHEPIAGITDSPASDTPGRPTVEVTLSSTIEVVASATPEVVSQANTATFTVLPPASETATEVPTMLPSLTSIPDDSESLAVVVDVSGEIESYDREAGEAVIDGVPVKVAVAPGIEIAAGEMFTLSGTLQNDGTLLVEVVQANTSEDTERPTSCESLPDNAACHPVLSTLADAFDVPYEELENLEASGFGMGEIARIYLIASTTQTPVEKVIQLRQTGTNWNTIIEQSSDGAEDLMVRQVIIGNGRGETVQETDDNVYVFPGVGNEPESDEAGEGNRPDDVPADDAGNSSPGNSGNAPGRNKTPPGQNSNPGNNPPGQDNNPGDNPPGQGNNPPGQDNNPGNNPPGQGGNPPGKGEK
jgi:hypothetical protein